MNYFKLFATPKTRVTFRWKDYDSKECYLAIYEAVRFGYNTRETILDVLPQFSINRLVLALDKLIASGMAEISFGHLSISDDMLILDVLVKGEPLELPIAFEKLERNSPLLNEILSYLGLKNPSGAQELLKFSIKETE